MSTSNDSGKTPEPATDAFPRWVWLAGAGAMLLIGWAFILLTNGFHLTAPVVFVCLGYAAGVAAVYTLFRTGATAAATDDAGDDAGWGRPIGARAELEREKKALLKAIKEAEFDLQMGKLSKADAEAMISTFRAQAIAVIREIDRKDGDDVSVREQIEREVRARLEVAKSKKMIEGERKPQGKKGKKGGAAAAQTGKKAEAADKPVEQAAESAAKAEGAETAEVAETPAEATQPAEVAAAAATAEAEAAKPAEETSTAAAADDDNGSSDETAAADAGKAAANSGATAVPPSNTELHGQVAGAGGDVAKEATS
jgi:hypothetical protein